MCPPKIVEDFVGRRGFSPLFDPPTTELELQKTRFCSCCIETPTIGLENTKLTEPENIKPINYHDQI